MQPLVPLSISKSREYPADFVILEYTIESTQCYKTLHIQLVQGVRHVHSSRLLYGENPQPINHITPESNVQHCYIYVNIETRKCNLEHFAN